MSSENGIKSKVETHECVSAACCGENTKNPWPTKEKKGKSWFDKLKIKGLSNGLCHWVKYQLLVSTLDNCSCGGVGWDS